MARILVVDDHEENRGVISTLLQYAGHELLEAADGETALEKTRVAHPDLVVTDILMPKLDGWGFLRSLRTDPDTCETPVVFYSAMRLSQEATDAALAQGVVGFLSKPIEPESVLEAVDKALRRQGANELTGPAKLAESELQSRIGVLSTRLWEKLQELDAIRSQLEARIESRTAELEAANRKSQTEIAERRRAEDELREANHQLTLRAAHLEQRTQEVRLLTEMSELLQACHDVEEAHRVTMQFARKLFPHHSGALYLAREFGEVLEVFAAWGPEERSMKQNFLPNECWALRRGRSHVVEDVSQGTACDHLSENGTFGFICVPMITQGQTLGVLHVCWDEKGASSEPRSAESARRLAVALADTTSMALSNVKLRERLQQQTIRDPLTGLFNRRYLEETLDREVSRARRGGVSLGVIMLDVDHFKRLNDSFGHPAGDAILRSLGKYLRSRVRQEDIATRYGGEEFALILPGASVEISRQRAESLRTGVHTTPELVEIGDAEIHKAITLSLGVAVFPANATSSAGLLRAADEALYLAKGSGRDCVVVASSGEAEQTATHQIPA